MEDFASILGCPRVDPPFNYLGIRVDCRHKKAKDWKYVIDKIWDKLRKWRNIKVSLAGRITLANFVLSAMPLFALSMFKAPSCVLREIVSLQQKFLWGGREGVRKIVWVKWDTLVRPKRFGGLGLRDLICMNRALLGKWGWRVIQGEKAVWVDVAVRSGATRGGGLSGVSAILPDARSRGWWGDVLECLSDSKGNWYMEQLERRVGNGERTSFWEDRWVSEQPLRVIFPKIFDLCLDKECSVKGAGGWEGDSWRWEVGWRRDFREWELNKLNDLIQLLRCRQSAEPVEDRWTWKLEKSGEFSVRSSYKLLVGRNSAEEWSAPSWTKLLWKSWAIPKAQSAAWRVIMGRIATKVELAKRGMLTQSSDKSCAVCGEDDDYINHLFLRCRRTWDLWARVIDWISFQAPVPGNVVETLSLVSYMGENKQMRKLLASISACVVWSIWKRRNDIVFNNKTWETEEVLNEIKSVTWGWGVGRKIFRGGNEIL